MTTFKQLLTAVNHNIEQEKQRKLQEDRDKFEKERLQRLKDNRTKLERLRIACPNLFTAEDLLITINEDKGYMIIQHKDDVEENAVSVYVNDPKTPLAGYSWSMYANPYVAGGLIDSKNCEQEMIKALEGFWCLTP